MYYQPEIETMPREQLRALQLERMRASVRHAYDNVEFYRKAFAEAGVTPDDLNSLEDLAKFPFVVKQDMRDAYPFGLFAVPTKDVARIHASSGTTGQPITAGEVTIIPVSRISLGFGTGGSEFGGKAPKNLGENPFGGGGGAGLKVIPVGFLVVSGTSVKMLPVDTATESPADRLVELIPDLLEQVSKKWEERKAKKQAEPEITEEDLV